MCVCVLVCCVYACVCMCVCVCMYAVRVVVWCVFVCMCVCVYMCVCACLCVCVCVCVCEAYMPTAGALQHVMFYNGGIVSGGNQTHISHWKLDGSLAQRAETSSESVFSIRYTHTHLHTQAHTHTHTCCTSTHAHMQAHTHTHTSRSLLDGSFAPHTHTHTHSQTHTHTYTATNLSRVCWPPAEALPLLMSTQRVHKSHSLCQLRLQHISVCVCVCVCRCVLCVSRQSTLLRCLHQSSCIIPPRGKGGGGQDRR